MRLNNFMIVVMSFFISVLLFTACMTNNIRNQPLTEKLIASDVHLNDDIKGLSGFNEYAVSPEFKAFAISTGKTGQIHAWAKA